jgi:hypothetical protein
MRAHVPNTVGPEERPIVPTYQDESTYNANDGLSAGWVTEDWYPLRPEGEGAGINVSTLSHRPDGFAHRDRLPKYGLAEGWRMDASQAAMVMECGKGTWWNSEHLVKQLEEVTIPLFNLAFPGCRALFVLDNATLHRSYKDDALRARNVNLYPGGKQAIMRPGRDCHEPSGVAIQRRPCLPCLSSRLRCPCPRARTSWTCPGLGPSLGLGLCLDPPAGYELSPVGAPARAPRSRGHQRSLALRHHSRCCWCAVRVRR